MIRYLQYLILGLTIVLTSCSSDNSLEYCRLHRTETGKILMKKESTLKTKDNEKIKFQHYQKGHDVVIVIAHGFFNSKDAPLLQQLKDSLVSEYDVFMFDFRGHGGSSGSFCWSSKEGQDIKAVLDYLSPRYKNIGFVAFSMGAAISIQAAAEYGGIGSLVAISSPAQYAKIDYRFWELDMENDILYNLKEGKIGKGVRPGAFWLSKKDPLDLAGKITCPVLYIHGEDDWVIRPWHSEELFKKTTSKKKLLLVENGPHAEYLFRKNSAEVLKAIKEWFEETIKDEGGDEKRITGK